MKNFELNEEWDVLVNKHSDELTKTLKENCRFDDLNLFEINIKTALNNFLTESINQFCSRIVTEVEEREKKTWDSVK